MRQYLHALLLTVSAEPVEHGRNASTGAQHLGDVFRNMQPGPFFFPHRFFCDEHKLFVIPTLTESGLEERRLEWQEFVARTVPLYVVQKRNGMEFGRHPILGMAIFADPKNIPETTFDSMTMPDRLSPAFPDNGVEYEPHVAYELDIYDPLPLPRRCGMTVMLQLSGWELEGAETPENIPRGWL